MPVFQFDLPEGIKNFVEGQAAERGRSPEDFVKQVLLDRQKALELERLRDKLQMGIDQLKRGEYREYSDEYWLELKARMQASSQRKEP